MLFAESHTACARCPQRPQTTTAQKDDHPGRPPIRVAVHLKAPPGRSKAPPRRRRAERRAPGPAPGQQRPAACWPPREAPRPPAAAGPPRAREWGPHNEGAPPRTERSNWDFSLKWCVNHDVEMEPGGALESRCLAFPRARASFLWVCDPVRALVWRRVYLPSRAAWTLPGLVLAGGPSRLSVGGAASRAKGQFGGRARRR